MTLIDTIEPAREATPAPDAAPASAAHSARGWLWQVGVAVLIAAALAAIHSGGGFRLVDDAVHDLRLRGLDIRASGDIVVVEIDPESLRRLGQWPWPRGHHARVLDLLFEAGAERIGVDVSFSSPSDPAQDARLAAAAARGGERLVLPVFQQWHTRPDGEPVLLLDRPLPQLFARTPLASINVVPDPDGIVRQLPVVEQVDGVVLPFLATALLDAQGSGAPDPYLVDFAIDPNTLPRLSFADVLLGDFDPAVVAGRSVLIGATALELGDVLAVPRWGNLAGVLVIATGYESLVQGRTIRPLDAAWFVFAIALAAALAPLSRQGAGLVPSVVTAAIQLAFLAGLSQLLYVEWALKLDLAPLAAALLLAHGLQVGRLLRAQARRILLQNREAERRQALLRSVVATSIDAVVITDRRGRILLANPACRVVFGSEPDALLGQEVATLVDPFDAVAKDLLAMCRQDGEVPPFSYPVDITGLDRLGGQLALELALSEVAGEDPGTESMLTGRHFIFVFRDVAEQRALEASRRQALQAQVDAERMKANFLATASHELRTPLNHIRGFASLLEAGIGGVLSDRQRGYVDDIGTAADHLSEIVTDILSYAELAAGDQSIAAADVAAGDLVADAVRELSALAGSRRVRIRIGGDGLDCPVHVDATAMGRAVMHVLRNAVQFCPEAGTVVIDVRRRPGSLAIAIADHGPGMETADFDRMVDAFGKSEDAFTTTHGGLGIGLSLTRACLQRHGGRLAIESMPGKGTTVTLVLPLEEGPLISSAA